MVSNRKSLLEISCYLVFAVVAILANFFLPSVLGLLMVLLAIIGIALGHSFLLFIFSFFNIFLGIAFDYYLRVTDKNFLFYFKNGAEIEFMAVLTILVIIVLHVFDVLMPNNASGKLEFDVKLPDISGRFYLFLLVLIVWAAFFVLANTNSVFETGFDLQELSKYSFLEYFALIILFFVKSAGTRSPWRHLAIAISFGFIFVMLITSYRMVAIVCAIALFIAAYDKVSIGRLKLISILVSAYVLMSFFSYYRQGNFDVSFANLMGYHGGVLNNNFTGVIETALIYTSVSVRQGLAENVGFLVGAVLPIPSSLIPDSMLYYVDLYDKHYTRIPGGGLLTGFFIYFRYLLAPLIFGYLYLAMKYKHRNYIFAGMYVISVCCIARWWLYGPYV